MLNPKGNNSNLTSRPSGSTKILYQLPATPLSGTGGIHRYTLGGFTSIPDLFSTITGGIFSEKWKELHESGNYFKAMK